jgi:hypothetical protein
VTHPISSGEYGVGDVPRFVRWPGQIFNDLGDDA